MNTQMKIKYNGELVSLNAYFNTCLGYWHEDPHKYQFVHMLHNLLAENIILPLDRTNPDNYIEDKKGMRLYSWQLLDEKQIDTITGVGRYGQKVYIPHVGNYEASYYGTSFEIPDTVGGFERYEHMLSIVYLVDHLTFEAFRNGYDTYDEKNVAKKTVANCSVAELLFAVNKKLNKEN